MGKVLHFLDHWSSVLIGLACLAAALLLWVAGVEPAEPSATALAPLTILGNHDGDTIKAAELVLVLRPADIRLAGIDCPELAQPGPWGAKARDRLAELLRCGRPTAEVIGVDVYGRALAIVRVGGVDVAEVLVSDGLAYAWVPMGEPRPQNYARLLTAETGARMDRVGVWGDPDARRPWVWRAERRGRTEVPLLLMPLTGPYLGP